MHARLPQVMGDFHALQPTVGAVIFGLEWLPAMHGAVVVDKHHVPGLQPVGQLGVLLGSAHVTPPKAEQRPPPPYERRGRIDGELHRHAPVRSQ